MTGAHVLRDATAHIYVRFVLLEFILQGSAVESKNSEVHTVLENPKVGMYKYSLRYLLFGINRQFFLFGTIRHSGDTGASISFEVRGG